MADSAYITVTATMLPDEIAKKISGSMTVAPDDANDKWYYKLTACTAKSTNLIACSFLDYTAVDDDTAPTAVHANDLVDGLFIGPEQTWFGRLPNTTVENLHAISSDIADPGDATANLIVAALIDDVA